MNKFTNFLLFLVLALPFALSAQGDAHRNCSTMDNLEMRQQNDPLLEGKMQEIEDFTANYVRNFEGNNRAVTTIPVMVHVIYSNSAENISDSQINTQIDVLNKDFGRTNNDRTNYWPQASATNIQFCLKEVTRKSSTKSSWRTDDSMKKSSRGGVDPVDPATTLNIWVCNLSGGILGYAQFPGGSASTDGVVCLYTAFGTNGTASAPYDLGRTTTHEVGHYLNLRHIWGDGGCSVDDYVNDTPASDGANYACGATSCGTEDMVQNYMDYTNDACMNLFTAGQAARMQACLDGSRSGLGTVGCGGTTTPTCSDGVQNGNETGVDCGGSCEPCQVAGPCDAPSNLYSQSRKGGKSARLSWNAVSSATSYNVRLRQAGSSSWTTKSTSSTQSDFSVTKNRNYEWEVQSNCGGDLSTWASSTFTAGTSGRFGETLEVSVYPNPASNFINVEINSSEEVTISIHDMLGRTLQTTTAIENTTINFDRMDSGIYLVRVTTSEGTTTIQKVMISK